MYTLIYMYDVYVMLIVCTYIHCSMCTYMHAHITCMHVCMHVFMSNVYSSAVYILYNMYVTYILYSILLC